MQYVATSNDACNYVGVSDDANDDANNE